MGVSLGFLCIFGCLDVENLDEVCKGVRNVLTGWLGGHIKRALLLFAQDLRASYLI